MKLVERALYELLKGLASGRVYTPLAPPKTVDPFVTIQRVGSDRWRSLAGPSGMTAAEIQIDAYAQTYYAAKALGGQIIDLLDGYRGTVTAGSESIRIGAVSLEDDADLVDQEEEPLLFRNLLRFNVIFDDGG
jgi:hypothetical protein